MTCKTSQILFPTMDGFGVLSVGFFHPRQKLIEIQWIFQLMQKLPALGAVIPSAVFHRSFSKRFGMKKAAYAVGRKVRLELA